MRLYQGQHAFYAGLDLHTRMMYLCVVNPEREIVLHRNLKSATAIPSPDVND